MKKMIVAIAMSLMLVGVEANAQQGVGDRGSLVERIAALESTLRSAIILTDRQCSEIGPNWQPYGPMSGRFPLAAGSGRDDREETREFSFGSEGGEYQHQLTVAEMPAHRHRHHDRFGRGVRADYGDDEPSEIHDARRSTEASGGGQPHNNMPPYAVVYFCWQR